MKLFQVSEYDCVMATSADEAIRIIADYYELPHGEGYEPARLREVTEEEMDRRMFRDDDGRRTFREELARRMAENPVPQLFGSTLE